LSLYTVVQLTLRDKHTTAFTLEEVEPKSLKQIDVFAIFLKGKGFSAAEFARRCNLLLANQRYDCYRYWAHKAFLSFAFPLMREILYHPIDYD